MTTYTVFSSEHGSVYGRGLTAEEAMDARLTHDGYRYEIRKGEFNGAPCWDLWTSDGSQNSTRGAQHMVETVIFSFELDEGRATRAIAEQIVKVDRLGWPRLPDCMTDADFDAMQARLAAENADDP